jgi:hypothetical protein
VSASQRLRAALAAVAVSTAAIGLGATLVSGGATAATPAPSITLDRACYVRTGLTPPPMTITGAGFTPGDLVTITDSRGTLDATTMVSTIATTVTGPSLLLKQPGQEGDEVIAADGTSSGATLTARAHTFISILGAGHGTTTSKRGLRALRERTTWVFSGWPMNKTIFVHYLVKGRAVARQAFGRPAAPCGVLHTVRPLFPKTPHLASYATQIDTHKHYSTKTTPRFTLLRVGLQLEFGPNRQRRPPGRPATGGGS